MWATLYGLGGYFLGKNVTRLAGPVGIAVAVIAAIIIIAFLVFLKRNEKRLEEEAERALPGPLDLRPAKGRQARDSTHPPEQPQARDDGSPA